MKQLNQQFGRTYQPVEPIIRMDISTCWANNSDGPINLFNKLFQWNYQPIEPIILKYWTDIVTVLESYASM